MIVFALTYSLLALFGDSVKMRDCFIICPIGDDGSDIRSRSDKLLRHVFDPVLSEMKYRAVRADKIPKAGLITSQIINMVIESPLVIADLTDGNPNVFYELAIRHSTGKPFVQIIHKHSKIPFDIAGVRTIVIDLTDPDSIDSAKESLRLQITEFDKGHKADSPVSVAAGVRLLKNDQGFAEELVKKIDNLVGSGFCSIDDLEERVSDLNSKVEEMDESINRIVSVLESVDQKLD